MVCLTADAGLALLYLLALHGLIGFAVFCYFVATLIVAAGPGTACLAAASAALLVQGCLRLIHTTLCPDLAGAGRGQDELIGLANRVAIPRSGGCRSHEVY